MLIPQDIDRNQHVILESTPEFLHFLKREYTDYADTLFVMKNLSNGTDSVCGWINKDRGIFVSLHGRVGLLGGFNRSDAKRLDDVFRPKTQYYGNRGAKQVETSLQNEQARKDQKTRDNIRDFKAHVRRHVNTVRQDDPWFTQELGQCHFSPTP
jgi:hypothetical protein